MLKNLNHLTLAASDISRSLQFYVEILGFIPHAQWDQGAYLSLGQLWLCLSKDSVDTKRDYTHYAFTIGIQDFTDFILKLRQAGVVYFLDPDGHKLEAHCGDLQSRLQACRQNPYQGMKFF
jgi:catechol 2,3-dioxygenase-like lactoylglutathione lyase family enzyme